MDEAINGYSITEHVFERAEMVRACDELLRTVKTRTKAGARHVLTLPAVRELSSDPRLVSLARRFVGSQPVAFRATLFDKSQTSNWLVAWHQDTALPLRRRVDNTEWGPWSVKAGVLYAHAPARALEKVVALRVHLDDSTAANGPLRVLPGTHVLGVLTDAEMERLARDATPVDCIPPSGGVVAMRPLTIHASSKASEGGPRRVLHIEYAEAIQLGRGLELDRR